MVVSTAGQIFGAKQCNFAQRSANLNWVKHLASATVRKPMKTGAKTLS